MNRRLAATVIALFLAMPVHAEDEQPATDTKAEEAPAKDRGDGISSPKKMSGMRILAEFIPNIGKQGSPGFCWMNLFRHAKSTTGQS